MTIASRNSQQNKENFKEDAIIPLVGYNGYSLQRYC
jgi:hypothetical protein